MLVFGNELDWLGGLDDPDGLNWTTQRYIARCRELIPGIRAINPKIPLGVFSKTATSGFADHGEAWNKEIILNLGPDVDMIAFHNYYHINNAALLEMSGHSLEVIEKFIAPEYNTSHLKIYLEEHGHFEDWTDAVERTKIQAFKGAMSMAMHFCRRLQDPMISMATFHGISVLLDDRCQTHPAISCIGLVRPRWASHTVRQNLLDHWPQSVSQGYSVYSCDASLATHSRSVS